MNILTQVAPKPITIDVAFLIGLSDGQSGKSLYTGFDMFCGRQFRSYELGHKLAQVGKAKCGGDPLYVAWVAQQPQRSGFTFGGDFSKCVGTFENSPGYAERYG